jgi:hypothetical protein
MLGIELGTSLKIIGISGSLSLLWTTSGLLSLDRVGRVKPLIFSASGMAAALIVNSVMAKFYVLADNPNPNHDALRGMVAMNFVFSLFFTYVGIISWVYPPEVCHICSLLKSTLTFLLTRSSPPRFVPEVHRSRHSPTGPLISSSPSARLWACRTSASPSSTSSSHGTSLQRFATPCSTRRPKARPWNRWTPSSVTRSFPQSWRILRRPLISSSATMSRTLRSSRARHLEGLPPQEIGRLSSTGNKPYHSISPV